MTSQGKMDKGITVRTETHIRLGKLGHWGDTMDTIINRLLDMNDRVEAQKKAVEAMKPGREPTGLTQH